MVDNSASSGEQTEKGFLRPNRSPLVRSVRLIKRLTSKRRKKEDAEHVKNERVMAHWTRYVGVFTFVLAICALANVIVIYMQLGEMHSGGIDTHNLAKAAHDQAAATDKLKGAGDAQAKALERLRLAGEAQATAADKLRLAGENQARAMEGLRGAGEAQARSTAALADNSGKQIAALTQSAEAAKVQAESAQLQSAAVIKSADATIIASKATDRLALAGKSQSDAVIRSLYLAKEANNIASQSSSAEHRPWLEISMPGGNGLSPTPSIGADYVVQIILTNKGRSPGLLATVKVQMEIVAVTPTTSLSDLPPCQQNCQRSTVFPNNGGFSETGLGYKPTIPGNMMTKDEIERLNKFEDAIILRTRVDYLDTSGVAHHTVGCSYYQPKLQGTGGFTSCLIGNQAD